MNLCREKTGREDASQHATTKKCLSGTPRARKTAGQQREDPRRLECHFALFRNRPPRGQSQAQEDAPNLRPGRRAVARCPSDRPRSDTGRPRARPRAKLYARASHEELVKAVACVDQIARPHGTHHYEELISRYRSVRLFLPKLLELPFEGLPAGQIVLGGLAAVRTLEGRRRIGRDEIPGTLVTPTWERSVFVEPDQVERRSFTFCVLEQLRSALRRRDVFVSKSTQWGDPRAQLLGPDSWGKARTSTCRMLGLSSTPKPFLENIGRELDEAYRRTADRWRQNAAVRIEVAGGREELVLTGLDGLEDPPSLVELRTLTERMLPQVDLPELLLEVNAWTGFADAFTHVSETRSRIPDLPTSVCAALIADACNIALEPLVRKDTPALTRGRLSWIKQNYFRAATLIQANAALVDCQMTIPLAQHWGGGEVASADGLRFVVPVRTLNAGPNPRYFGTGRGVTYYNFTSDQFTGFHAIVVPGTIRDSLYVLDGLLEHETSLEVQEIVTDTAAYSDLIFGLFRLLGFQFSPRLADLGRHAVLAYQSPRGIRAAEQSCTESHQPQTHPKSLG